MKSIFKKDNLLSSLRIPKLHDLFLQKYLVIVLPIKPPEPNINIFIFSLYF